MSAVSLFKFKDHDVRTVQIDGEPWFSGADAGAAATIANVGNVYKRLDDVEKRYIHRVDLGLPAGKPMVLISESGLYKMVMRSDKPEAKEFQNWVTRVVIPAIRKDGG